VVGHFLLALLMLRCRACGLPALGANVHVSYARMYAGTFFPVVLSRAAAAARFHCCARSVRCGSPGELVSGGDWMPSGALCGGCCTEGEHETWRRRRGLCVYES